MKKFLFVPLVALALGSCSTDENQINNGETGNGDESRSYASITLASPRGAASRAPGYNEDDYEYGSANENNVNSIRFYFFYADGQPTPVAKQAGTNSYVSYVDWTPAASDLTTGDPDGTTVEKIVKITVGINQPAGSQHPNLVLAVINPPASLTSYSGTLNLSNVKNLVADYYTGLHNDNFVITNTAYVDGNSNIISATPITENHLKPSQDDPTLQTLIIYVERVLARIDLQLNLTNNAITVTPTDGSSSYTIYQVSEQQVNGDETDIYMRLLGWNVAQFTNTSRLVKDINIWPSNLFGDLEPWNISEYHRSFWAINPQNVEYTYNTFVNVPGTDYPYASELPIPANGSKADPVYIQENAADYESAKTGSGASHPTSLVFAAQLVDVNGNPLPLVKWANKYYTQSGVLNSIANSLNLWSKTTTTQDGTSGVLFTHITPADLQFVSAETLYGQEGLPDDVAEYFTFVQLSSTAQSKEWYTGNTPESASISVNEVNSMILQGVGSLYVWNEGESYYYIDIRHLGEEGAPGYVGIVRNHIYNVNLTNIEGLGTPIFNPDEVFHPQVPTTDENIISAEVRILQWRVVSQDYNISW